MGRKAQRNTKSRIVSAAWELFYEQGYDDTTIEEIVERSQTSKGSFYHYFAGKDGLLSTLSTLFDEKYEELTQEMDPEMDSFDKMIYLNQALFFMIENSVSLDLLARLFSSQLVTKSEKHLLDQNRYYYRLLRAIVKEGQTRGQLRADVPVGEIVKAYALCERGMMYDWCISDGSYSLSQYAAMALPRLMQGYRN